MRGAELIETSGPANHLIACVATSEAREAVLRVTQGACRVQFCAYAADLADAAKQESATIIVWELGSGAEPDIEAVSRAVRSRSKALQVLVRTGLTRPTARHLLTIAQKLPLAHVSLRGHDALQRDIAALLDESATPSADGEIIRRLVPLVPNVAADIVAAASLAGHRRTRVGELASLGGLSVRVLESRLKAARIVPAEHLLGWMVSLHSLWRRDVLAWTSKHTASSTGFDSPSVWSKYVARQTGIRPTTLLQKGGFQHLLDRCERQVFLDSLAHGS